MKLYSAISHSRGRPARSTMAATPAGPTSRSTKGMSPFVMMQLMVPSTAILSTHDPQRGL